MLAPCGVYCGACPSFDRTCRGCGSTSRDQKRSSKWSCKIRCCCAEKGIDSCQECSELPCRKYRVKLLRGKEGDERYDYRLECQGNLRRRGEVGDDQWLDEQADRWRCPLCGGRVFFYHYICSDCGGSHHPR